MKQKNKEMRAIKFLGICVPVINVMYSAVYMGIAGSDLYTVSSKPRVLLMLLCMMITSCCLCCVCLSPDDTKTTSSILWIVGYFLNIVLNLAVFMRILAKDIVDFALYTSCSVALFIARMNLNGKLEVYNIATDGEVGKLQIIELFED